MEEAKYHFQDKIFYAKNSYDALENADALLLLTGWNEFRRPDFDRLKSLLKTPIIFDGRNQYDVNKIKNKDIEYVCIGINCA